MDMSIRVTALIFPSRNNETTILKTSVDLKAETASRTQVFSALPDYSKANKGCVQTAFFISLTVRHGYMLCSPDINKLFKVLCHIQLDENDSPTCTLINY